jgi:hypothetical protein
MFGKRMMLLVLLAASMLVSGYASASEPEAADRSPLKKLVLLEEWTNGLYQASVDENRQLAYTYALRIQTLVLEPELRRIGEPTGWSRIDDHVRTVVRSLNRGELSPTWREDASKLKLAVDALAAGRKSLWLQYERLLHEDISRLQKAWQRGGSEGAEAAAAALSQLRLHVSRMEAAAAVSEQPERVRTLLDRIRYAEKLIAAPEQTDAQRMMAEGAFVLIGDAVDRLFENRASIVHAQAVGRPSWQWTFMLTTIVLSTLAYTAWRKFRAMQQAIPVPKRPASR